MLKALHSTVFDNYINGNITPPLNGQYLLVENPAKGIVYAHAADSDSADIDTAVGAATAAFPQWANTPADRRAALLLEIARLIDHYLPELALAECEDSGKPLSVASTVDIPRAAANFRFFATALLHFASESHYTDGLNAINYTLRRPIGVVGCISPWNLPLYLFTWKIAPALAAGNCVVAKPSEVTPRTAYLLAEICRQAGLPAGVLNIVHGTGPRAGQAIVEHRDIKAVSFTGSTRAGRDIARIAAPMFKKLSLELGGKNPNIIFADCNFDDMLETTIRSSFNNQGQICLCGSRILVEKTIYPRFLEAFTARVRQLKIGNPQATNTNIGAVVSKQHLEKILSYINLAQQEGGTLHYGGQQVVLDGESANGYYIQPTIITGLGPDCRTNQEEIFGPVVTLMPFEDEQEALEMANNSPYGLSATVWTQHLDRAHRFAEQLQAGIVWINCWMLRDLRTPFGGVKQSGIGREGGWEAMRFFTEPKNICLKISK